MGILDALAGLKGVGGKLGKGLLIESFLMFNEDALINALKEILDDTGIGPKEIPDYVFGNKALPIPPDAFSNMKGFEDYIETIETERLFEWLTKARPDLALALAACGDEGAEYMARLKWFFVDSIKAAPLKEKANPAKETPPVPEEEGEPEAKVTAPPAAPEEEEEAPEENEDTPQGEPGPKRFMVTCEECGNSVYLTQEELDNLETCPNCGEPANLKK